MCDHIKRLSYFDQVTNLKLKKKWKQNDEEEEWGYINMLWLMIVALAFVIN